MKKLIVLALLLAMFAGGCGNVYLTGEALTAAETSALDAYNAQTRAVTGGPTSQPAEPAWVRSYLAENFKQWRSFVRAAKRDLNWGPKLEGE